MSKFDELRSAIRAMDGTINAFESATLESIIAELRQGSVSDYRLRALERPSRQALGSIRPTLVPSAAGGGKSVAIVSLHGIALYDLAYWPLAFSTRAFAQSMSALGSDASISAIVLDINTPGGQVTGTQEAADAVWAVRQKKPVIGVVNPLCASAGYWIGSQCTKLIGVPSADIGSIGVFMTHYDLSGMLAKAGIKPTFIYAGKHKVDGNSYEPLSEDANSWFKSQVYATYRDFVGAVARGRGTTSGQVESRMGQGRVLMAKDALSVGMIDQIVPTPDAALQQAISGSFPARSAARAGDEFRHRLADLARDPGKTSAETYRQRLALLREG